MFSQLLESSGRREHRRAGGAVSMVAHAVLIAFATAATAVDAPKPEGVGAPAPLAAYVPPPVERRTPAPPSGPQPRLPSPPPLEEAFPWPPVDVSGVLPSLDSRAAAIAGAEFTSRGIAVGEPFVGVSVPTDGSPLFAFQVERQATPLPGNPRPRYPQAMRDAGRSGEVLAQFVVDTTGRVELRTLRILSATDDAFTRAVREALPQLRFLSAHVGGRRVRQVVQQPFVFELGT